MKIYETNNLILREINEVDIDNFTHYLLENKTFLEPWSPLVDESYYEKDNLLKIIQSDIKSNADKNSLKLGIFFKDNNKVIGTIALSNIVYGPFLSCFLGYKLHRDYIKNGYMSEALEKIISIAFEELNLHRIEANIIPKNIASQNLVKKFGFQNEGLSKKYLKINGIWEDHYHFVLLNSELE